MKGGQDVKRCSRCKTVCKGLVKTAYTDERGVTVDGRLCTNCRATLQNQGKLA